MCSSTWIIQSISSGMLFVVSLRVKPICFSFSFPALCNVAEPESKSNSDSNINLSPTILISSLFPSISCKRPKNSERYFWSSNTLEVSALFNLSPKTSILSSLVRISCSLASSAEFNVLISFFNTSISFVKKATCSKVEEAFNWASNISVSVLSISCCFSFSSAAILWFKLCISVFWVKDWMFSSSFLRFLVVFGIVILGPVFYSPKSCAQIKPDEVINKLDANYYYPHKKGLVNISAQLEWDQQDLTSEKKTILKKPF